MFDNTEQILLKHKEQLLNQYSINLNNLIDIDINKIDLSFKKIYYIDNNIIRNNIIIENKCDLIYKCICNNIIYSYNLNKYEGYEFTKNINYLNSFLKNLPNSLFNNNSICDDFYIDHSLLFNFKILNNDKKNNDIFVIYKYNIDFIKLILNIYNKYVINLNDYNLIIYDEYFDFQKIKFLISIINEKKIYNSFNINDYFKCLLQYFNFN